MVWLIGGCSIYFNIFLFIVTFITNVIFIPKFGINGAALATFVSILTFNSVRMLYVYKKMNFHPFSIKTAIALLMILVIYFLISILPLSSASLISSIINIIIRCVIACSLVIAVVQYFKLSEDISHIIHNSMEKLRRKWIRD